MQLVRLLACATVCVSVMSAWAEDAAKPLNLTLPQSVIGSAPAAHDASAAAALKQKCMALGNERNQLQKNPIDPATGTISSGRKSRLQAISNEMQKAGCWNIPKAQ